MPGCFYFSLKKLAKFLMSIFAKKGTVFAKKGTVFVKKGTVFAKKRNGIC